MCKLGDVEMCKWERASVVLSFSSALLHIYFFCAAAKKVTKKAALISETVIFSTVSMRASPFGKIALPH